MARVPSIIVTLGTLAIFRTFLVEYSDARTITTASLPDWLVRPAAKDRVLDRRVRSRVIVAIALAAALVFALALWRCAPRASSTRSDPTRMRRRWPASTAARVVFAAFVAERRAGGACRASFSWQSSAIITVVAGPRTRAEVSRRGGGRRGQHLRRFGNHSGRGAGHPAGRHHRQSLTRWAVVSEFWREALLGILIMIAVAADTLLARSMTRAKAGDTKTGTSAGTTAP